jgi:hypothetical protein
MKKLLILLLVSVAFMACNRPSAAEQRRAEKHVRDSIALTEQERSLTYYQSQLDLLMPQVDSLLPLFRYEKNEKYQDHGYYVATGRDGLRVMVRDDGQLPILMYRYGQRIEKADDEAVQRANHLQILMADVHELEIRIRKTSLEIQKYQKRLQK